VVPAGGPQRGYGIPGILNSLLWDDVYGKGMLLAGESNIDTSRYNDLCSVYCGCREACKKG